MAKIRPDLGMLPELHSFLKNSGGNLWTVSEASGTRARDETGEKLTQSWNLTCMVACGKETMCLMPLDLAFLQESGESRNNPSSQTQ